MRFLGFVLLLAAAVYSAPNNGGDRYHHRAQSTLSRNSLPLPKNSGENTAAFWYHEAQESLKQRLQNFQNIKTAKNVIMFLGDGLSIPTLGAARTLLGQRQGRTGEESKLAVESFPGVGLSKTYCVDAQIADSACSATAYLTGVKANIGTIGVTSDVLRDNCAAATNPDYMVDSIAVWALADGRDAGLVTTTRVTHASPSGVYAHTADREWESDADVIEAGCEGGQWDIARQLVHGFPGNQLKVILGGGRQEFLPNTTIDEEGKHGHRLDGRNLIEDWHLDKTQKNQKSTYVWNREQLLTASEDGYLLGLFEDTHMRYHLEPESADEPSLAEMTEAAINRLSQNPDGYFLFVEGGRIDHGHHANYIHLALDETLEFNKAIALAANITGDDTLIVVTADHAHVMAYSGYSQRGNDILGLSDDVDDDEVPYLTLSYTNGPGYRDHTDNGIRVDVSEELDKKSIWFRATAEVPLESETHGGDDVAVFARGPQHHVFTGVYEQSQLPHLMAYAACIGPGRHACDDVD